MINQPTESATLVIERLIPAAPERVFAAWTDPAQIMQWWGPQGVACPHAEMDLRVGGRYRIANALPDGRVVWIAGELTEVTPPSRLAYTWGMESDGVASPETSHVTVTFTAEGTGTRVRIVHERLGDEAVRKEHAMGWEGCLDGLVAHVAG
jgi:uncharacterized protein YndB with AHSA1/START domain